jgi:hypothetical protein
MNRAFSTLVFCVLMFTALAVAQDQPSTKAHVTQPVADQLLAGTVEVTVTLPAQMSDPVYVGLGGPPWARLERVENTSEWSGQLNSRMVPNGPQTLIVKTASKKADTTVAVKVNNAPRVYFADLHSHTGYSDGHLLPAVAHDYARNVAKLDVFSLTDHLEYVDDAEWLDMRDAAFKANEDGKFVAVPGLEWTKKLGHANIFDPKTNRWPTELAAFYQAVADAGVVCKFNHPGTGEDVFDGLAYSAIGDKAFQLMEVRRAPEEQAYIRALKQGWHIAPDGSDDTHVPNWGGGFAWSGLLMPGLSQRNVLHALANRHCYSTLDRNCILTFRVNGATMGDIIEAPAKTVSVTITVNDPDAEDLITRIELFEDGAVIQIDEPKSRQRTWKTTFNPKPGPHFYFVKISQADKNMLWSAPIWLTISDM